MTNEQMALRIQAGEKNLSGALWKKNAKLFRLMANKLYNNFYNRCVSSGVTEDDIFQCSYFALCAAVEAYNPENGYKFTAYIKYPLKNHFNALVGLRTSKRDPLNNAESLNKPVSEEGDAELIDLHIDPDSEIPFENVISDIYSVDIRKTLQNAIDELPEQHAAVIRRRYFEGKSPQEIAAEMDITNSRVSYLHRNGIHKLYLNELLKAFYDETLEKWAYRGTGFTAFKENRASSVERTVIELDKLHASQKRRLERTLYEGERV